VLKKILGVLALASCALSSAYAAQNTYDTQDRASVESGFGLYFPFGDIYNDRYQLWFSSAYLAGNQGTITSISNYLYDSPENAPWVGQAAWNVEIWASSTATNYAGLHPTVTSGGLNSSVLDQNLGADATKVYDGWITLTSQGLTFQTSAKFNYSSGNLLLDYRLKGFAGGITGRDDSQWPNVYNGPTFQIHTTNDAVAEVISNTYDSEGVYKPERDYSLPLRTSIGFQSTTPVPEPEAWLMLLAGLGLIATMGRLRRR
jgi:hypothetical protein